MLFQIINHKDNTVKAFADPIALKNEVQVITGSYDEAMYVLEWARTPAIGSFRYDHDDFEILIIGQE